MIGISRKISFSMRVDKNAIKRKNNIKASREDFTEDQIEKISTKNLRKNFIKCHVNNYVGLIHQHIQ